MGMIIDGKYKPGKVDHDRINRRHNNPTYQLHEHNRQRKDFSREITQPYNRDGTPNQDFIQAWPEESKGYGFIPSDKDLKNE